MAKTISNPVHRSLCEMAVNKALQQIDDELGVEPLTEATDSTDTGTEDANSKDVNPKGTNPKDPSPRDTNSEATDPKDTKSQNPNPQRLDLISKQSYSRKPDWKTHSVMEKHMKLENVLCTIHLTLKTFLLKSRYNEHRDQYEHEMLITICPASWLVKLGISFAPRGSLFRSTISGWKYQLNAFRLVPSDALIFEFCLNNNLAGVQSLLSRGEASVKDMDLWGRTPLHVSNPLV